MFGNPMEIALLVGAAVLLFGADKVPKLARGMGQAKKEFLVGQAEAEVAAERTRAEARAAAETRLNADAAAKTPVTDVVSPVSSTVEIPAEPRRA